MLTTSIERGDRRQLVELLNDMAQKARAGVAKLPPRGGGERGRVLYLLPPSNTGECAWCCCFDVCERHYKGRFSRWAGGFSSEGFVDG